MKISVKSKFKLNDVVLFKQYADETRYAETHGIITEICVEVSSDKTRILYNIAYENQSNESRIDYVDEYNVIDKIQKRKNKNIIDKLKNMIAIF